MNQIFDNKFTKAFTFGTPKEVSTFIANQQAEKHLIIEDSFGDWHYCYVCYHSLTREKLFFIAFSSDTKDELLNLLFWEDLLVLDTGKKIYLIDANLKIIAQHEITTMLVGLHLINKERLLILEEAYLRVLSYQGETMMTLKFDLIENFKVTGNRIKIWTSEEQLEINLS